jgi:hypothetical protein
MKLATALSFLTLVLALGFTREAEAQVDRRDMVKMPQVYQEHFMASMRGHLDALDDILGYMAAEKITEAALTAEEMLGLSSSTFSTDSPITVYLPKPMRELGKNLNQAASRFSVALQNVDIDKNYESMRKAMDALREVTSACRACHATYRVR